MSKLIGLAIAAMFLLPPANPNRERFTKYKAIEAYEIRPGILMMPSYSSDGQVCEIGIEKLHYSPVMIRLGSDLSQKEIDQIFEELVPATERGLKSKDFDGLISQSGNGLITYIDYENVTIQIYGDASPGKHYVTTVVEVAATIKWKNRKCQ
jgi:hypothetical protein